MRIKVSPRFDVVIRAIQMRVKKKRSEQILCGRKEKQQTPNDTIAAAIAVAIIVMNLARQWHNILVKMLH